MIIGLSQTLSPRAIVVLVAERSVYTVASRARPLKLASTPAVRPTSPDLCPDCALADCASPEFAMAWTCMSNLSVRGYASKVEVPVPEQS
jgi:hypothetical protein